MASLFYWDIFYNFAVLFLVSSFSKEVAKGKIPPKSEFSDLNQIDKTLLVTNKTQNDGRSYSSLKNGNLNR